MPSHTWVPAGMAASGRVLPTVMGASAPERSTLPAVTRCGASTYEYALFISSARMCKPNDIDSQLPHIAAHNSGQYQIRHIQLQSVKTVASRLAVIVCFMRRSTEKFASPSPYLTSAMRAERLGSYSMRCTTPSCPSRLPRMSMSRNSRLWPPPRCHAVTLQCAEQCPE